MDLAPDVEVDVQNFADFDLYIFKPIICENNGAVIYFHGGGFVCYSVPAYRRFLSYMAKEAGAIIFAPNYRLDQK